MKSFLGIGILILLLLAIGIAIYQGMEFIDETFQPQYERFREIKPGMDEPKVRSLLGEPQMIFYRETAPDGYYVDGYAYKQRPITNKVYIYVAGEPIAYIWFDAGDEVEEVFVGGS